MNALDRAPTGPTPAQAPSTPRVRSMSLAKDRLDVGLLTDDTAMLTFLSQDVGLGDAQILPITAGVTQHRFDVDGSVLKANLVEQLPTQRRSGYAGIIIAAAAPGPPRALEGPDGLRIDIVPPGHAGVRQLGIVLRVPDLGRARRYFAEALGWAVEDTRVQLGASTIVLEETRDAPKRVEMPVRGWTYLTVQVHDCDLETGAAVDAGATLVRPPENLGEVARFALIADPFGNQLEVSQRASLTGPIR